jgi:hypothetical protein
MSTIPPRAVHGGTPAAYSRDFHETLQALAKGEHSLNATCKHDGSGASIALESGGLDGAVAFSDTIEGARERALGRLAATMLEVLAWRPELPPEGPCEACGESRPS